MSFRIAFALMFLLILHFVNCCLAGDVYLFSDDRDCLSIVLGGVDGNAMVPDSDEDEFLASAYGIAYSGDLTNIVVGSADSYLQLLPYINFPQSHQLDALAVGDI